MKETKKVGNKWLSIRVNEKEYQVIEDLYQKTTCRSISEYARNILFQLLKFQIFLPVNS